MRFRSIEFACDWAAKFRLCGAVKEEAQAPLLRHPPLIQTGEDQPRHANRSIRLLRFRPSPRSGRNFTMAFDLESFPLSSGPSYKALSYTWGSPFLAGPAFDWHKDLMHSDLDGRYEKKRDWITPRYTINCNGEVVKIRLNLYEALACLLLENERSWLWIDAICINQVDTKEKGSQVEMMADIFRQAEAVIVWMGPKHWDFIDSTRLMDKLSPVLQQYDPESGLFGENKISLHDPQSQPLPESGHHPTSHSSAASAYWAGFFNLCRRSWFWRRWTLQEMAVARRVQVFCGPCLLDWSKLSFLSVYFYRTRFDHLDGGPDSRDKSNPFIGMIPTLAFQASQFLSLHFSGTAHRQQLESAYLHTYGTANTGALLTELLYRAKLLRCVEARDILFGIHSVLLLLTDQKHHNIFYIDYQINVETLYQQVAQHILTTVPSLAVLSLKQHVEAPDLSGDLLEPSLLPQTAYKRSKDVLLAAVPAFGQYGWRMRQEYAQQKRRHRRLFRESKLDLDLPSWVPDLWANSNSRRVRPSLGLERPFFQRTVYNAAFASVTMPPRKTVGRILHLNGHYVGTIDACVDRLTALRSMARFVRYLEICSQLPLQMRGGQPRVEAFWRTLVLDLERHNEMRHPASPGLGEGLYHWIVGQLNGMRWARRKGFKLFQYCCRLISGMPDMVPGFHFLSAGPGEPWYQKLLDTKVQTVMRGSPQIYSRQKYLSLLGEMEGAKGLPLFKTQEGDIGQGSFQQRPGDQVWVLENGRVPFILRPRKESAPFVLVEECYLHGIMDGELMQSNALVYRPITIA